MSKEIVAYCRCCHKVTKHKVINCEETFRWRLFEAIISAGISTAFGYEYNCECQECGNINTVRR